MKEISGRELCRAIERRGWVLVRINGSHHIYAMEGRRERVVIPVHGSRPLKIGLLRSLMKIVGIREGDL